MTVSARDIRARLRQRDQDERRKREEAVVAVGVAAAAAVKSRADNDAALRAAFEAALKTREAEARAGKLREAFEAALAGSPQVVEAEVAAGLAVIAAAEFKVTQGQLAELTGHRVEDLRRWTQLARRAAPAGATAGSGGGQGGAERSSVKPATGFAVVAATEETVVDDAVGGEGSSVAAS